MYEPRHHKPIPRRHFVRRMIIHILLSTGLIAVSLAAGMIGYAYYEGLGWQDAFLNAAMLLGGMGRWSLRRRMEENCLPDCMPSMPDSCFLSP